MCPLPRLALVCFFLAAPVLRAAPAPKSTATDTALISAADLLKVQQLGSPEISPDGRWVVYTVKSVVTKPATAGEFGYRTQLWLTATDGATPPRELTHAEQAATSPQWSPDGRSIAFVRGETGKGQLWILPLADGGEALQVTKLDTNVAAP